MGRLQSKYNCLELNDTLNHLLKTGTCSIFKRNNASKKMKAYKYFKKILNSSF